MLTFILGMFMSFGMAAVYKHIPVYYPDNVGSVGGPGRHDRRPWRVCIPIAFGAMADLTGVWTSCFMLLFAFVSGAMLWMHLAIRRMERRNVPGCAASRSCRKWKGSRSTDSRLLPKGRPSRRARPSWLQRRACPGGIGAPDCMSSAPVLGRPGLIITGYPVFRRSAATAISRAMICINHRRRATPS